jgi:hypothetical protein
MAIAHILFILIRLERVADFFGNLTYSLISPDYGVRDGQLVRLRALSSAQRCSESDSRLVSPAPLWSPLKIRGQNPEDQTLVGTETLVPRRLT